MALFGLVALPGFSLANDLNGLCAGAGKAGDAPFSVFSKALFQSLTDSLFYVDALGSLGATPLKLAEVKDAAFSSSQSAQAVEQFSVLLSGPVGSALPSATYWVEHASIGRFRLHLQQTLDDPSGSLYSAHFSLICLG